MAQYYNFEINYYSYNCMKWNEKFLERKYGAFTIYCKKNILHFGRKPLMQHVYIVNSGYLKSRCRDKTNTNVFCRLYQWIIHINGPTKFQLAQTCMHIRQLSMMIFTLKTSRKYCTLQKTWTHSCLCKHKNKDWNQRKKTPIW